jgi:hypothetical protein
MYNEAKEINHVLNDASTVVLAYSSIWLQRPGF